MKNYYEILGVQKDAEDFVIRAAYKALAQKYHPDKWKSNLDESSKKMQEINRAYEVLSDKDKRTAYDENLKESNSNKSSDNSHQKKTSKNYSNYLEFFSKYFKKIILSILVISILYFAVEGLKESESTLVVLKCNEQLYLVKDAKDEINYIKITKKFMSTVPYKLYSSNPDFDLKDTPPYLTGISIDYVNTSKLSSLKREHFPPDWYTFLTPDEISKNGLPLLQYVIYLNRSTLKIESKLAGDGTVWSDGKCELVDFAEFENDWQSKVKNKQKKFKF